METSIDSLTRAIAELSLETRSAHTSTLAQASLATASLQNLHQTAHQIVAGIAQLNTAINNTLADIRNISQRLLEVEEQRANEERRHRRRQEREARGEQRVPVNPLETQV